MKSISEPSFFINLLVDKFPYTPTERQSILLEKLVHFFFSKNNDTIFLIKGYAGTGKSSIVGLVTKNLWRTEMKSVLLAPTGRAAKVISSYANRDAFTIHKKIYFPKKNKNGSVSFVLQPNKHNNTIFWVDEASMISGEGSSGKLFENSSLLSDLIQYVDSGKNCKLIFIGDTAQLPPVKLNISPALEEDTFRLEYHKLVETIELNEVTRQQENSGILANATELRNQIEFLVNNFKFQLNYLDITRLEDSFEIEDAIQSSYTNNGVEDTTIIVRSNKRANLYNQQIRRKILGLESDISVGDYVMIVKNNYFWLSDNSDAGFIANGDVCEVIRIQNTKKLYGFSFAEVTVRMIDYPNQKPFETVLLLDTLTSETPSLSYEESNKLYESVLEDYAHEKSKYKKMLSVKNNKYFNALQVKFSYAVTCHKSQGGQWKKVLVEQPYLPNGVSTEYYRWLYTAITRAEEKLYLIGFSDDFF